MMKKRLSWSLHPREWRLVLAAACLIGCWVIVSWLIQPLWEQVRDLKLQITTKTEQHETMTQLLAEAPAIERAYQGIARNLQTKGEAGRERVFLSELEQLARIADVQLNMKPRPLKREERMDRFEVELDLSGSHAQLLQFLDALLNMPRVITLERLRLSAVPARQDTVQATLVMPHLTFHEPAR